MQRVAQDWLVLTVLTDYSGTAVGITTSLQFLPMLLLGPYAGSIADRYRKRRILLWTQSAMGLCGLLVGLLILAGAIELWHVYGAALCLGLASAVDGPARQAFVSEVVHRDDLQNAVALNSASFNSARLVGPAIAGVLIAWVGTGPVFILNAASFAAVFLALWRLRLTEVIPEAQANDSGHRVLEGIAYVRRRPDLMLILVMVGILGTFSMNFQIIGALMVTAEFGGGPAEFGLVSSILALGTLGGALLAARRPAPRLRFLLGGAAALGFFSILGSAAPYDWLYAAALVPIGVAAMTFLNSCNSAIQFSVESRFRARVLALYLAVFQGGVAAGAPLIGWVATEFGPRWSMAVGGTVALITGLIASAVVTRNNGSSIRHLLARKFRTEHSHNKGLNTGLFSHRRRGLHLLHVSLKKLLHFLRPPSGL